MKAQLLNICQYSKKTLDSFNQQDAVRACNILHKTKNKELRKINSSKKGSYVVSLVEGLLERENNVLPSIINNRSALIITTPTVYKLYGGKMADLLKRSNLNIKIEVIACNENNKMLSMVEQVCFLAQRNAIDRRGLLISFGGGVCSDIVAVAASIIRRGISCVKIPTTLIGQIDAAIGVKGAINFCNKKSYLGCFYSPEAVLIDPNFLNTLPENHLRFGFAEIIKMALVRDNNLFSLIESHASNLLANKFKMPLVEGNRIIWLAITRMLEELEMNIYENKTYERLVDMGHTFSPAIESASDFTISHGEAVAIDMALTATLAKNLGYFPEQHYERLINIIARLNLPLYTPSLDTAMSSQSLLEAAKHRGGHCNLVVPTAIGKATFINRIEEINNHDLQLAITQLSDVAMKLNRVIS